MPKPWFIAFLLIAVAAHSQTVELKGTITGIADENLRVLLPTDWYGQRKLQEIPVQSSGFQCNAAIPASGLSEFQYKGKERSYFLWSQAKTLELSFEAEFLDGDVELNGDAAPIHQFVSAVHEKFGSKLTTKWLEEQAKDASNIDAMEMETFRLRNDVLYMLKETETHLPEEFESAYRNHLGYFYYLSLFKFSEAKSATSRIPKATEIPKVLLEGLDWDRMNRTEELDSEFFRELLLQFVRYKTLESYDFMKFATVESAVQEEYNLAREQLKGRALQFFLTSTMLKNARNVQPSLLRNMLAALQSTENAESELKLVSDSLSVRLAAKDDEVEVIPQQTNADNDRIDLELEGLTGKTFKISELSGKVIYLDIWASWCGPCRKEFPHSKALKDKLTKKESKQIEFLYISIDNTETVWKMAIEELGIEGVHGLSKGGWGSEATAKFGVRSIPRYLILDKKGRVVDGNAPRPSDPRLLEILQKLAAD